MVPLNEYLEMQFPKMRKFIDDIAAVEGVGSNSNSKKTGTISKMFGKIGKKRSSVVSVDTHCIDVELECTSLTRLIKKQFDKMQQVQLPEDQIPLLKQALDQMEIATKAKEGINEEISK